MNVGISINTIFIYCTYSTRKWWPVQFSINAFVYIRVQEQVIIMANLRRAKRSVVNVLKTLSSKVIMMYPVIVFLIFDYCAWNPGLVGVHANPDAKRLYDDLLSNYNRLIRPVINHTDKVTVKLGVSLSQLVELVSIISLF